MEKERKYKTIGIIAVIVAIIGLSVAFAALSQTLTINGSAKNLSSTWSIVWEEIDNQTIVPSNGVGVQTGYPKLDNVTLVKDNTAVLTGVNLDLGTITLHKPGDSATFRINIANKGDIDAKVTGVTGVSLNNTYVSYSVKYLDNNTDITSAQGRLLEAGDRKLVLIEVKFKEDVTTEQYSQIPSEGIEVSLNGVSVAYTQDDGTGTLDPEVCESNAPEGAVKLGNSNEEFYKLWETNTEIAYLAKFNLKYGIDKATGEFSSVIRQGCNERGFLMGGATYYSHEFAPSSYWYNSDTQSVLETPINYRTKKPKYFGPYEKLPQGENGSPTYVYDSNSSLYNVIEQYGNYMRSRGVNVLEARLVSGEELSPYTSSSHWAYYTSYWTGSINTSPGLVYSILATHTVGANPTQSNALGIRPVIVVGK